MTDVDALVSAGRAAHEKTTQGEWRRARAGVYRPSSRFLVIDDSAMKGADAEFIVYAHNNWLVLMDTLERLQGEYQQLRAALGTIHAWATTTHAPGAKRPIEVWPGLAEPLSVLASSFSVVHWGPAHGTGLTQCCGKTPFELSRTDRMTDVAESITCQGVVRG